MPMGGDDGARAFWRDAVGLTEVTPPPELAGRPVRWFRAFDELGAISIEVHVLADEHFVPARLAQPGDPGQLGGRTGGPRRADRVRWLRAQLGPADDIRRLSALPLLGRLRQPGRGDDPRPVTPRTVLPVTGDGSSGHQGRFFRSPGTVLPVTGDGSLGHQGRFFRSPSTPTLWRRGERPAAPGDRVEANRKPIRPHRTRRGHHHAGALVDLSRPGSGWQRSTWCLDAAAPFSARRGGRGVQAAVQLRSSAGFIVGPDNADDRQAQIPCSQPTLRRPAPSSSSVVPA